MVRNATGLFLGQREEGAPRFGEQVEISEVRSAITAIGVVRRVGRALVLFHVPRVPLCDVFKDSVRHCLDVAQEDKCQPIVRIADSLAIVQQTMRTQGDHRLR